MAEYSRPASGFKLRFDGIKTNAIPDALPEYKYPYAVNVRSYLDSSIQSRPQINQSIAAPANGGPVLALEPTNGVYKIGSKLFVNAAQVDTGYTPDIPCSIMPFRPNASPNAYDYVFDSTKMSKVFVPSSGAPVVNKTGIAEPQSAPDMCVDQFNVFEFTGVAANWSITGTAGALTDILRINADTCVALFADPASVAPSLTTRYSMQVTGNFSYQAYMTVNVTKSGGGSTPMVVQDVLPSISTQSSVSIEDILYFVGNTGRCIIAVSQMPIDNSVPEFEGLNPIGESSTNQAILSGLRRGTLVQLGTGGNKEVVFVLNVVHGLLGQISFECVTVNTHVASEALIGIPAITVATSDPAIGFIGQAVNATAIQSAATIGIAEVFKFITAPNNPFTHQPFIGDPLLPTAQQDDYIHVSVNVSDLTLLTEFRILFDVGDGSFAQNYFYYAARPGDLTQAVSGSQTQLAGAQLAAQRQAIDSSLSADIQPTINPGVSRRLPGTSVASDINSSDQTALGVSQWSEIMFPIRSLTRVGNDQSKTLANCGGIKLRAIVTGTVTVQFGSVWVGSGGQPDIGDTGFLLFYRVRPRNSSTGAKGNPSPSTRYGVAPRRQQVIVSLPSAAYDSQIDTWDIFRFGGALTAWKYVGSTLSSNGTFSDNNFDGAIVNNDTLDFDLLEPFPQIGPPISSNGVSVVGTVALITFPIAANNPAAAGTLSQLGNLLPGNVFIIGPSAYTLQKRPELNLVLLGTQTYRFTFVENIGKLSNVLVQCVEPLLANQASGSVFGPDSNGVFFSVGPLRPGLVSWTNPNDPDSASDANTRDLCPTSEPLQNGIIVEGTPIVLSAKRGWRGISRQDDLGNLIYDWQEVPLGRGLAGRYALCSDGQIGYYVASDGVYRTGGGRAESITDNDLSNLFPHEAIFPQDVTYCGNTIFAPEYKYAINFQLEIVNGFLYFDYLDKTQTYRTLVYDTRKDAWVPDTYVNPVSIHSGVTIPASNSAAPGGAVRNQVLFTGDTSGVIGVEQSFPVASAGEIVSCIASTREEVIGDLRANKMFGDAMVDLLAPGGPVTITPVFLGALFNTATIIGGGMIARPSSPPTVNLNGQSLQRTMGLQFSWSDQGVSTLLHSWQPSYVTQPEDISNRVTDWNDAGTPGNKFIQGFQIDLDTANQIKTLIVRDNDSQSLHSFTSDNAALAANQVQANGRQLVTCAFIQPFTAHMVRLESLENKIYRLFGLKWIAEPTPEAALLWQNQATSFGQPGYSHIKEILAAYVSQAPVTLTITAFDGLSPVQIVLPNTNGGYQKLRFPLSPNKGLLYTFSGLSTKPWQCFMSDWEIKIKTWGSSGAYESVKILGNQHGDTAAI